MAAPYSVGANGVCDTWKTEYSCEPHLGGAEFPLHVSRIRGMLGHIVKGLMLARGRAAE
jgi:hypothetical protein